MNRILASAIVLLLSMSVYAAPENGASLDVQDHGMAGVTLRYSLPVNAESDSPLDFAAMGFTSTADGRDIPVISRLVAVPAGHEVAIEVTSRLSYHLGDVSQFDNNNGADVSSRLISGDEIRSLILEPPVAAIAGRVEILRGVPVAPVSIFPYQFVGDNGELVQNRELEVKIQFKPDADAPTVKPINDRPGSAAARMLDRLILNRPNRDFDEEQFEHRGRILIIHQDDEEFFHVETGGRRWVDDLADWKRRMGFRVDIEAIVLDEMLSNDIRNLVRQDYYDVEDPISYLIIIGSDDRQQQVYMPSFIRGELIGDHFYSLMDDEDRYLSDIAVGRIDVEGYNQLHTVVNRSILYELNPYREEGTQWFSRAMYTAEHIGVQGGGFVPSMVHLGSWLWMKLLQFGYTQVDTIYSRVNENPRDDEVEAALGEGRSLVLSRGWLSGCYDFNEDVPADTRRKNPFVLAITCLAHTRQTPFYRGGTPENLLGPIATMTITQITHSKTNNALIGGAVRSMINFNTYEAGWIQNFGKYQMYLDNMYLLLPYHLETLAAIRLMGDPSVNIFTDAPFEFDVDHPAEISPQATGFNLEVTTNGEPVEDATVCVWQQEGVHYVTQPGDDGWARFTFEAGELEEGELLVTITRHNAMPYFTSVDVVERGAIVELSQVAFENEDNLFGNGEAIPTTLTFTNAGNADLHNLSITLSTEDPWVSFSDDSLEIANLNRGRSDQVQFNLEFHRVSWAGRTVRIDINVSDGENEWQHAFNCITSGHLLEIPLIGVPNAPFLRGEIPQIVPTLRNQGDLPSPPLQAALVSLDEPYVTVRGGGIVNYPELEGGNADIPNGALLVEIDELAIPGNIAHFQMILSALDGEDDFRDTVYFEEPIGEAVDTDPFGPDEYGYICFDSFDEDWEKAPEYEWIEINPNIQDDLDGTRLEFGDEAVDLDATILVELPFEFRYYGEPFDTIAVNSNGWIAFGAEQGLFLDFRNQQLPGIQGPDAQVAVFWQDLINPVPFQRGTFHFYDEQRGIFIIEWSQLKIYHDGNDNDPEANLIEFQVILYDQSRTPTFTGDGEIKMQYKTVFITEGDQWDNLYFTTGLKNLDNTGGLQYTYWDNYSPGCHRLENEMAILFTTDRVLSNGVLEGRITSRSSGDALLGVEVYSERNHQDTVTTVDGCFRFSQIPAGEHVIRFSKPGYNNLWVNATVNQDEVTRLDTSLTNPVLQVSPDPIEKQLQPGANGVTFPLDIENTGSGPLTYNLSRRYSDGSATNYAERWVSNITEAVDDNWIFGCQFVDDTLYVSGGRDRREVDDNMIYVIDRQGNTVRSFNQPSNTRYGLRDLAWDGEYLYGGEDISDTLRIAVFDLSGNLIRNIVIQCLPIDNLDKPYGLAWDPDENLLVVGFEASNILFVNQQGQVVRRISPALRTGVLKISGLAWNRFDDDQMPLYIMDVPLNGGMRLLKANPISGEVRTLSLLQNLDRYKGTGLSIGLDWERAVISLATVDGGPARDDDDFLRVFEIGPDTHYLLIDPVAGEVVADSESSVQFEFRADGLDLGFYRMGLLLEHNADVDPVLIPMSLEVTHDTFKDDKDNDVPLMFGLDEAYPNPFNGTTRIAFTITDAGYTHLAVYDINGREVAVLLNDHLPAGKHSVTFKPQAFSSGIYLYRVQSGGKSIVKRMVYLR